MCTNLKCQWLSAGSRYETFPSPIKATGSIFMFVLQYEL